MKQNTELSLDIIREGTDNFFSENTLCIINVISGTVIINKNDRYETGGLKVINPFQAYRCDTEKGAALLLSIPLSLLRETDMKHCGLIVCNAPDHTVKGKNNEYDHIRKLLANLWVINFDENSEQRKKNLRAKIKDLFRLLQNFFASQEGSLFQLGKDPPNQKVYAVINYIREHWTEDIRISEIADHVKLSPNYLSRFWHKKMGVPLSAYINGIRLEHAKKSLRGSGGITDIALSCGFADANALNRNFKKRFGILPKQYRSQLSATAVSEDKTLDLRYFLSYADTLNEGKKPQTENKSIQINWNTKGTLLTHTWKRLVNIGFAHDGLLQMIQEQLIQAQQEIGFEYVRFHGIFDEDMHIYNEDEQHNLYPNFIICDMLLDFFLSIHLKPYIEFSYTPKALAVNQNRELDRETYYSKVNDPEKWHQLVRLFLNHIISRYGISQVSQWRFTVAGRELQLQGYLTREEFLEHYCNTYRAVKSVDTSLKFGGFGSHSNLILDTDQTEIHLEYCQKADCLPDFITVQNYPIQSIEISSNFSPILLKKISPVTVSPNIHYSASLVQRMKDILKKYHLEDKEIWFEEWNSSIWQRDATNDTCFKATWMVKDICENYDRVQAFAYWLLTDFIEERLPRNGSAYFGGFGIFNYNGIPKASWLAMQLLQKTGSHCILKGDGYFVTRKNSSIQILLYHYVHYDNMYRLCNQIPVSPEQAYEVFLQRSDRKYHITINDAPGKLCRVKKYILNREHGSSFDRWVAMGQTSNLKADEIDYLKNSAVPDIRLQVCPYNGQILLETVMHAHECILYDIEFR